jgi:hypothetical protein
MAERIGYMMDRAQGNPVPAGGRRGCSLPITLARVSANPAWVWPTASHQAQDFAEKVLKPKLEK